MLDPKRNVLSWVSTLESSSKQSTNVTRETNISTTAYYCTVGKQGSRKIEPGKEWKDATLNIDERKDLVSS